MKEELLEAIYGTVERLEQKVDELSAPPKNAEIGRTPAPISVDTSKLEESILSVSAKEEETIVRIPVDTRSLIPVISVHSISNLQYRRQS